MSYYLKILLDNIIKKIKIIFQYIFIIGFLLSNLNSSSVESTKRVTNNMFMDTNSLVNSYHNRKKNVKNYIFSSYN